MPKQSNDTYKYPYTSRLFEYYEEGCVKKFLYQGNLVNHLTVEKHQCLLERFSLRDTGMQIFASNLERVSHRELVSIVLENTANFNKQTSHILNLTEGWALPKGRKITRLTSKQIEYLVSKFNDSIKNNIRWKSRAMAAEMEHSKDRGVFVFSATELLKPSQIRSYFSRLKSSQKRKIPIEECDEEDVEAFKQEQAIDKIVKQQQLRQRAHNSDQLDHATSPNRWN